MTVCHFMLVQDLISRICFWTLFRGMQFPVKSLGAEGIECLDRTLGSQDNPGWHGPQKFSRALSSRVLKTSKLRECTTSPGSLIHCLTVVTEISPILIQLELVFVSYSSLSEANFMKEQKTWPWTDLTAVGREIVFMCMCLEKEGRFLELYCYTT